MTDIRLNISWYTSLKRKGLIRRLGHQGVTAIVDLWLYTAQHKPDGNLIGLSDEDITEAAQYEGDSKGFILAIGPKPEGLGFLDGDSGAYKLHDWKEHNPWAYHAKARSKAAKRAVEERWRKEREMRDEYEAHTERIQDEEQAHIPLSSSDSLPSPKPIPLPSPEDKTVKPDLPDECIELVKQLFPDLKQSEVRKQAEAIEQLFRLDAYTMDDVEQVLKWAKTDMGGNDPDWPGWSTQFLSCCQLRVKKHGVMKFAKMKAGYERSKIKKPLRVYEK